MVVITGHSPKNGVASARLRPGDLDGLSTVHLDRGARDKPGHDN